MCVLGTRYSSGLAGAPRGDMALTVSTGFRHRVVWITAYVNKTLSESGQVRLASTRWQDEPEVDFNLLKDYRDLTRLATAFRLIATLHDLPAMQAAAADPFPATFSYKIRSVTAIRRRPRMSESLSVARWNTPQGEIPARASAA
jgi:5-(hydroxymethyl)furfural/furfural oxidase